MSTRLSKDFIQRRPIHLILALVMALPLVVLSGPGTVQAVAPEESGVSLRPIAVTLKTTTPWVRRGGIAVLKGRVTGVKGSVVTVWQRKVGQRKWRVEARKRASAAGYFTHREDVRTGTRDYRACTQRRCSKPVRVRMGVPPRTRTALEMTELTPLAIEAGKPFTVTGTASNLEGQSVSIQAYDGSASSWYSVGSALVSEGTWSTEASVSTAAKSVPVRARFAGTSRLSSSVSNSAEVDVYGWYYLADPGEPETVESHNWGYAGSYDINGNTYPKSLAGGVYRVGSWAEFNLSRSCVRVAATVGLPDVADTRTRASARVIADSVSKWEQSDIALGQDYQLDVDISRALRLRLEVIRTDDYGARDTLVFGNIRTLCAF